TDATAQITVLSSAPVGYHTVTLVTDGESAQLVQGLDVEQGTPTLLSTSPNGGQQGTTFNVLALSRFTHWQTGLTQASFGADGAFIVNSFTAVDSVSALIN